jgi:hypothetical protein
MNLRVLVAFVAVMLLLVVSYYALSTWLPQNFSTTPSGFDQCRDTPDDC